MSVHTERAQYIELWNTEIKKRFPNAETTRLPTVFLDVEHGEKDDVKRNLEELQRIVGKMPRFDCKDIKAVKAENDQLKAELENAKLCLEEQEKELAKAKSDLEQEKQKNAPGQRGMPKSEQNS